MDELERGIVVELQQNGRIPYVDLAEKLGVAEGTIRNRVRKLCEKGFINVVAVPNLRELGYNFSAIIGLELRMAEEQNVAEKLAHCENVCYLSFVTGKYDMIAIVMTRSADEFARFIKKELSAIPGIMRTESFVSIEVIKGSPALMDTRQLIHMLGSQQQHKGVE